MSILIELNDSSEQLKIIRDFINGGELSRLYDERKSKETIIEYLSEAEIKEALSDFTFIE